MMGKEKGKRIEEKKGAEDIKFTQQQLAFANKVLEFHLKNIKTANAYDILKESLKKYDSKTYAQTREISHGVIETTSDKDKYFNAKLQESISIITGIHFGDRKYFTEKDYTPVFNFKMDVAFRKTRKNNVLGLCINSNNGMKIASLENNLDEFVISVQKIAEQKIKESLLIQDKNQVKIVPQVVSAKTNGNEI